MDAAQFENIAINFYQNSSIGEEARSTIMSICHDPTSLCLFHTFLLNTHSNEAKYLSLQILGSNILFGWSALADPDRSNIKTDLFNLLESWCSYIRLKGDDSDEGENNYFDVQVQLVHQLDNAIIQILLAEWPSGWPDFLHEFINVAKSHLENVDENDEPTIYVFLNALYFMGQLSEQIRNPQSIVSTRKTELATALTNNFQTIFSFIKLALSIDIPKVQIEGLNALSYYFQWIDLKIISNDNIIENILGPVMNNLECRPFVLRCINTIVSRDLIVASPVIEQIFNLLIERVSSEITILEDPNLIEIFINTFSKFVCLDQCALMPNDIVIQWMLEYTKIADDDLLVEIISMWHNLAKCYALENQALPFSNDFLVPLQEVLCSKMCKPIEFGGDHNFYDEYAETLSLLIKMHYDDIFHLMIERMETLQFGTDEMMNWVFSIGVVPGSCDEAVEAELMSAIFSIILRYSNPNGNSEGGNAEGAPDQSIISMADAAFLYLAGQFTRYLLKNQQYFNLSLKKIEENITGGQPEFQLVALYSLKKIAIRCGKTLVATEFAQKLFQQFNEIIQQLPPEFHLPLFEGAMYLVKNNPNKNQRDEMTLELFQRVDSISTMAELVPIVDIESLPAMESMIHSMFGQFTSQEIDELSKKNFYDLFIGFIDHFPNSNLLGDFVQLFLDDFGQLCSLIGSQTTAENGGGTLVGIASADVKSLGGFSAIIHAHNEMAKQFMENQNNQEQQGMEESQQENAESEEKFENPNGPLLSNLFTNVVVPAFDMIKENMVDFPTLRQQFFTLIQAFCEDCSLLDPDMITDLLNFVFFGLKHPLPYLSGMCLDIVTNVLSQFDKCEDETFVNGFYEMFYVPLLTNLLALFGDGLHNGLFSQITQTISILLSIAASGKFSQLTQQSLTEILFKKLQELFQECKEDEIGLVANDIVNSIGNNGKLRSILSDFLISSRQIQITASPSMDDELVEHNDSQRTPEMEFLNEQQNGSQFMADNYVFPE